jgi:hypothetical protein
MSQEASQMPHHDEISPGPIEGLRLPPNAWHVLRRENIRTLNQLRAVAGRIERFEGVGPKTALATREELARVASFEERPSDEGRLRRPRIA